MAATAPKPLSSIIVPGQLAVRTIHGRNGPFKVGNLTTPIGKFTVKDAELEQYPEGKYQGEFVLRYIFIKPIHFQNGSVGFEQRANLDGMTLSGIDKLSKAEARAYSSSHDVDPLDEEQDPTPVATPAKAPKPQPAPEQASKSSQADSPPATGGADNDDAVLFGLLWPLGESVKLDSTIDRRTLRSQIERLGKLGYAHDFKSQLWHRKPGQQAA